MSLASDIAATWTAISRDDPPDVRSVPLPVRDAVATLAEVGQLVIEARTIAAGRTAEEQQGVESAARFWLELHGLPCGLFGCPELPVAEPCEITTTLVFERLCAFGLPAPLRH